MYTCWPPVLALGVPPGIVTDADTAAPVVATPEAEGAPPATVTDGDTAPTGAVVPDGEVVPVGPLALPVGAVEPETAPIEPVVATTLVPDGPEGTPDEVGGVESPAPRVATVPVVTPAVPVGVVTPEEVAPPDRARLGPVVLLVVGTPGVRPRGTLTVVGEPRALTVVGGPLEPAAVVVGRPVA
jgi:hypothetical protein